MKADYVKERIQRTHFQKEKIASKEQHGQINMKTVADIIVAKGTNVNHSPFNSAGLLYL